MTCLWANKCKTICPSPQSKMKNTCVGASFMHMLAVGVSIGQPAHHNPPLVYEKHSFSLNQECQSIVLQSFFPQKKKRVYSHTCSPLNLQTDWNSLKNDLTTAYKYQNTEHILWMICRVLDRGISSKYKHHLWSTKLLWMPDYIFGTHTKILNKGTGRLWISTLRCWSDLWSAFLVTSCLRIYLQ